MNARVRTFAFLVLLVGLMAAAPTRALGVPATPSASPTTSLVAQSEPAVEAPEPEAEEREQPWTLRFMVPTLMVLGVGGIVLSIVVYASRVLSRYRVVR